MNRKLKVLGLALVAVFAMSAMVASAAQGKTPGTLTTFPTTATTSIHGTQATPHAFKLTSQFINGEPATTTCNIAKFTSPAGSSVTDGATTVTLVPEYKECKTSGFNATVTVENCHYSVHLGTNTGGALGTHAVITLDNVAPGTCIIKITLLTCEVQVKAQEFATGNILTNSGTEKEMDLLLDTDITNKIAYTITKDGIGCPLTELGKTFNDGDYTGTTTVDGKNTVNGSTVGLTIH
jgi:hypothetical protein